MTTPLPDDPKVVTISREALRADLAEMELRLRIWIAAELGQKASVNELEELQLHVDKAAETLSELIPLHDMLVKEHNQMLAQWRRAEQGFFTEAQNHHMALTANKVLEKRLQQGWSKRERLFAVIAVAATFIATALNFLERTGIIF